MRLPCRHHGVDLWLKPVLPALPCDWNQAIIYLDRDGVLIEGSENYINSVDEVNLLDGAAHALGTLRRAGFRTCLVTNQSPVGRGLWTHETLHRIHERMQESLAAADEDAEVDLILYSPYAPWENSCARKPAAGMLRAGNVLINWAHTGESPTSSQKILETGSDQWVESAASAMVGDRLVDYQAGMSHGVRTFLVEGHLGLPMVLERLVDENDKGDHLF